MIASYINSILSGHIPLWIYLKNFGVLCKKRYLLWKYGHFQGLKNKEGFVEYDISAHTFYGNNKKQGISGIARLRNAEFFLELAIESHIMYFDEIILADNMSEDNTRAICQNLQNKYPEKIKAIQYPFMTHKLGSQEYKNSTSDSVYDLSYFYNRVLSKVSYKRVAKVDDDHIIIPEVMQHNRRLILNNQKKKTYYHMLGINTIYSDNDFRLPIKLPFMGLYGDHGFFPISSRTYYIHDKWSENFLHPYMVQYLPITFIHLKYLKDYHINYQGIYNKFNDTIMNGGYTLLPENYKDILNTLMI